MVLESLEIFNRKIKKGYEQHRILQAVQLELDL